MTNSNYAPSTRLDQTNHLHVVGGQFGSEGKGRVVQALCEEKKWDVAVRIGGPQAGHTFYYQDEKFVFKQVPIPTIYGAIGVIGRGAVVDLDLLRKEFDAIDRATGRKPVILLDPQAVVLSDLHKFREQEDGLEESIGSTTTGVGAARADHVMRNAPLVEDCAIDPRIVVMDTGRFLNSALMANKTVMFEGTQGLGLGLVHSGNYPYVTSADLTPMQIMASTGIRLQTLQHRPPPMVIGVFRTLPIRVGGHSGYLHRETNWETLQTVFHGDIPIEITTVTKRVRRVGNWDSRLARRSVREGGITHAVYTFLDYLDDHFETQRQWVAAREVELGIPTLGYSTGSGAKKGTFRWATK